MRILSIGRYSNLTIKLLCDRYIVNLTMKYSNKKLKANCRIIGTGRKSSICRDSSGLGTGKEFNEIIPLTGGIHSMIISSIVC